MGGLSSLAAINNQRSSLTVLSLAIIRSVSTLSHYIPDLWFAHFAFWCIYVHEKNWRSLIKKAWSMLIIKYQKVIINKPWGSFKKARSMLIIKYQQMIINKPWASLKKVLLMLIMKHYSIKERRSFVVQYFSKSYSFFTTLFTGTNWKESFMYFSEVLIYLFSHRIF